MKPACAGINVASARNKRRPLVVCAREEGRLVLLSFRRVRGFVD